MTININNKLEKTLTIFHYDKDKPQITTFNEAVIVAFTVLNGQKFLDIKIGQIWQSITFSTPCGFHVSIHENTFACISRSNFLLSLQTLVKTNNLLMAYDYIFEDKQFDTILISGSAKSLRCWLIPQTQINSKNDV